jgi:hypothetical protein
MFLAILRTLISALQRQRTEWKVTSGDPMTSCMTSSQTTGRRVEM